MPSPSQRWRHRPPGCVNTRELAEMSGARYGTVDYWALTGRVKVLGQRHPGSGTLRWHPVTEVDVVRRVWAMRKQGVELNRAFNEARVNVTSGV
jgi:hypothetical protein